MVPQKIIELSRNSKIFCNLGPEQRPLSEIPKEKWVRTEELATNRIWIYRPVVEFLRTLKKGEKVLILFQTLGGEVKTGILEINKIYWDSCDYPRLDFEQQADEGIFSFWGAFVIAIARVKPGTKTSLQEDSQYERFKELSNEVVL